MLLFLMESIGMFRWVYVSSYWTCILCDYFFLLFRSDLTPFLTILAKMEDGKNEDLELFTLTGICWILLELWFFVGISGFSGLELLQDDPQARNFQDLQELQVVTFWCVLSLMVNYLLLQQFNSREDARAGYQVQTAWRWGYETDDATPV